VHARRLILEDFRSYTELDLSLHPGAVLLLGPNGAGKTNILEALAVLALGVSPRTSDEVDLVRWGAALARIRADIAQPEGERRIEAVLFAPAPGERRRPKRFAVDGAPKRAADIAGQLRIVAFFPEEMALLTDPPAARRRYLDGVIGQGDALYRRALVDLGRVLDQRNALLRSWRDDGVSPRPEEIAFWDVELVRLGAVVAAARRRVITELAPHFVRSHQKLAGEQALSLEYVCQVVGEREDELAAGYRALLAEKRDREAWQGTTLVGPHRDDVRVSFEGRALPSFASRGEHRTAILALKMAEAAWVAERTGQDPIFLLDDVLSELDPPRRERLTSVISREAQCLITAAVTAGLPDSILHRSSVLTVSPGGVRADDR
jgi:DNA replication and repair protein RecF